MTIPNHFRHRLWLILSILSAFSMWYYVANIWSLGQPAEFSDLYAQWWGVHELLLHHRDPYSPGVARQIQMVIYGAPVESLHPGDAAELSGGFAYPIYVAFFMWPTVHLAFPVVQALFRCAFVAGTPMSLLLWLYVLRWRVQATELGTIVFFSLGSFPVLQGIKLQNLSLLVSFLVAATIASLAADYLTIAGLLLAGASVKPQFVILLIPWLTLWAVSDWTRRRRLAWSFLRRYGSACSRRRSAGSGMDQSFSGNCSSIPPIHLRAFPARRLVHSASRPPCSCCPVAGGAGALLAMPFRTCKFVTFRSGFLFGSGCDAGRNPDPGTSRPTSSYTGLSILAPERESYLAVGQDGATLVCGCMDSSGMGLGRFPGLESGRDLGSCRGAATALGPPSLS